eukprot:gnl/MRDRNA2_/MRDRNA2_165044_c0_seq1.p1 gnl/MRDRNA2_/MRDRNA2_165044_c0~~gnl/MRDRNA2_/MRDRNA2_165044_c0_seq1.p1  ORF type:complete len:297 (+),score=58.24 gnl/MRDRNA2_/MRDRNA2_165044_c0_seq1:80-892(+)
MAYPDPLLGGTTATGAVGCCSKFSSCMALLAGGGVAAIAGLGFIQLVATAGNLGPAGKVTNGTVAYVGCGCFWHMQHDMVHFEEKSLGRKGTELTAFTGYAGSKSTGTGGRVCYHNLGDVADYGELGYGEVVSIALPDVGAAGKLGEAFFGHMCPGGQRDDPQDMGAEYRALAGFPGGLESPEGQAFARAGKQQGVNVVAGKGSDPDTSGTVYVMDTAEFPFHQAELYHQFHDDMIDIYGEKYHDLIAALRASHALRATGCPSDKVPSAN